MIGKIYGIKEADDSEGISDDCKFLIYRNG
jgi:hypothetical protein